MTWQQLTLGSQDFVLRLLEDAKAQQRYRAQSSRSDADGLKYRAQCENELVALSAAIECLEDAR